MNEKEWFERIYHEHADFLFRLGKHFSCADDGALYDLMQDTFLDAWNKRAALMAHPNIGGWLTLSLKNRALAYQHKQRRRGLRSMYSLDEEETPPPADEGMTPEQAALLKDHLAELEELLGKENAMLFLAYALEGYTAKEIGGRWGLSEDCVWMRISRMKKKLAAHRELFYAMLLLSISLH